MKILNGLELAARLKAQQAETARTLATPKLAIIQVKDDPAINTYVNLKQKYGADIGVAVDIHFVEQAEAPALIKQLNEDDHVHGIIVQLPLSDTSQTDETLNLVAPHKDVDGLGVAAEFAPATPMAILELLKEHQIDLANKQVLIIGRGKLVGQPLIKILKQEGVKVSEADEHTTNLKELIKAAEVIITATGQPGLITADMLHGGQVIVDAGVASEAGKTVGDLAPDVYQRADISVTPAKGGVGPLTVCALFANLLKAAK